MGIRGLKRWNTTWEGWYRGGKDLNLEELNQLREEIMAPLTAFIEAFREEGRTVRTMTEAVVRLLEALSVEEKMLAREASFREQGEFGLAKEYGQVYGLVVDLMDRLARLLGDEKVSRAEILDAGFSEIKVGLIPAAVDRIVVGDITRTRLDHIKILFFIGVNDGIVPQKKENSSLFTDKEREFLGSHHIELAPTVRVESFRQRFYLYLALTKPAERLYLSFSAMDASGKSLRPSILLGELRKLFPQLTVVAASDEAAGVPLSIREARGRLTHGLRNFEMTREDSEFLELFRHFMMDEEQRENVKRLVDAAFYAYEERGIGKMAAKALYGTVLGGSVTRLEQYASCAYAHFLNYGLELAERQQYELAAMDIGNLFHDSIDLCFKKMKEQEDERKALVHTAVTEVTEEYGNTILKSSARNAYLARKVEKITDRTIWALAEQLRRGEFHVDGLEKSFDYIRDGMRLTGRIDRVDVAQDEGHVYVKVIDYKSGKTSFDLSRVYNGTQLQLTTYMNVAMNAYQLRYPEKEIVPAAMFYYRIDDPVLDYDAAASAEDRERARLRKLMVDGLVNTELSVVQKLDTGIEKASDILPVTIRAGAVDATKKNVASTKRFRDLGRFVDRKMQGFAQEIRDGRISVDPIRIGTDTTACSWCPYHSICRFDPRIDGYAYRSGEKLSAEDIWNEISPEEKKDAVDD